MHDSFSANMRVCLKGLLQGKPGTVSGMGMFAVGAAGWQHKLESCPGSLGRDTTAQVPWAEGTGWVTLLWAGLDISGHTLAQPVLGDSHLRFLPLPRGVSAPW